MARTKISEFSATPANNTDIDSINIAEGCAPSNINDAIRELMAQLKDFQIGAVGDSFNGPIGATTASTGAFTTLSSTGNTTLGDASGDAVTINGTATFANANPTLTAGTANGVTYLNGSKVLTSGSALTFDSAGNFGLGTASPTASSSNRTLTINGPATFGSLIDFKSNETLNLRIFSGVTNSVLSVKTATYLSFETNDTERIRIPADAGGIQFPAVQAASSNANTLDDYEEGTWTPSIGGTATYGTRIATYTKIGDTVRAYFDITIGTIGTGSTTILSGFPFSSNANNDAGCISYFDTLNATVLWLSIQMNAGTSCTFPGTTAATATIINGIAIFKSGTRVIGTVVYKT